MSGHLIGDQHMQIILNRFGVLSGSEGTGWRYSEVGYHILQLMKCFLFRFFLSLFMFSHLVSL